MMAKTVHDIVQWAANLDANKDWIFRGQSHNWALKAKIFRDDCRRKPDGSNRAYDPEKGVKEEKKLLNRFKNRAIPYLDFEIDNKCDLEWLAVAQHHGLPTRFLDWTRNVLVAAYCACEEMGNPLKCGEVREPKIFAIPCGKLLDTRGGKDKESNDVFNLRDDDIRYYEPPVISPRISAQSSVFTLQNHSYDFKKHKGYQELKIEKKSRNECAESKIKKQLHDFLGIDRHTLYLGIEGLASSLYWDYKWGPDT